MPRPSLNAPSSPTAYLQCHTPSDYASSVSCSSNIPLTGAQCIIDVGPATPCIFPMNTSTLAPGTHNITISNSNLSSSTSFVLKGEVGGEEGRRGRERGGRRGRGVRRGKERGRERGGRRGKRGEKREGERERRGGVREGRREGEKGEG